MKIGQTINGYTVVGVDGKDFSTKGGGLSTWTFARKGGVDYFMKEFLSPTYPLDSSPGSHKLKEKKKRDCLKFENHNKALITKVFKSVSTRSDLIFTRDFFRYNTKYYKVTEKIDVSSISYKEISRLPIQKRLLIIKTVSHSLEILHKLCIVHGDLKLNNILIKKTDGGYYTSKLIDFDDSYFEFQPPSIRDEVVGDPVYYSPELENYILDKNDSIGSDLSCKSDIFALGIIFCQYLTGLLPVGVAVDKYPSHIVNNGGVISIANSIELPNELIGLVNSMLLKNAKDRPSISEIFTLLKSISSIHDISHIHGVIKDSAVDTIKNSDKINPLTKNVFERNVIKMNDRLTISMGFKKNK